MKTRTLCVLTAVCASVVTLTVFPSSADHAAPAAKPDVTYTGTGMAVDPSGCTFEVKEFPFCKQLNLGQKCSHVLWNTPAGAINDLCLVEKVALSHQGASGVLAADSVKPEPMTLAGTVKAIDSAAHALTLYSGWTDKIFPVPASCQVLMYGEMAGSLAKLRPGDEVRVTYELPQDQPVAREIAQTHTTFAVKLTAIDPGNRMVKAKSPHATK